MKAKKILATLPILICMTIISFQIFSPCSVFAQNITKVQSDLKNIDINKLQSDVKTINERYEYIIKNFEIQHNTILYVSAVLASLLALIVFYFGWKAQKVEIEYEKIKEDRDKYREKYNDLLHELDNKLINLKTIESEINKIKDAISKDKDNINKLVETIVLDHTNDYLNANMDKIVDLKSDKSNEPVSEAFTKQLEDVSSHLEILESLQYESNPQLIYKKIDVYFKSKKYKEIIKIIRNIIENKEFDNNYLFHYAFSLAQENQINTALDIYSRYLIFKPKSHQALNNIAIIYKGRNEFPKAIEYLNQALEIEKTALYVSNLADCYEDVYEKVKIYKKYWDIISSDPTYLHKFRTIIENNFLIEEICTFGKNRYDNDNTLNNYLDYLEVCIISMNDKEIDNLIERKGDYNFNLKDIMMFKLLTTVRGCLKGEYKDDELNNINIILEGSPFTNFTWNFNLLNKVISQLKDGDVKDKIVQIINKLEELKKANSKKEAEVV